MRIRFRHVILLSSVLASGAMGSGPSPGSDPVGPPRSRLTGLPGPGGSGLLPVRVSGPARTQGELGLEIDRFLAEEVDLARERITWQAAAQRTGVSPPLHPSSYPYAGFVVGGPAFVSVPVPSGWDPGPVGAALALGFSYFSEAGQRTLRACGSFLEARGDALRTFWETRRGADGEAASPELLAAVERRKSEIRSYTPCRGFLPPVTPPVGPVRPPEELP